MHKAGWGQKAAALPVEVQRWHLYSLNTGPAHKISYSRSLQRSAHPLADRAAGSFMLQALAALMAPTQRLAATPLPGAACGAGRTRRLRLQTLSQEFISVSPCSMVPICSEGDLSKS